MHKAVRFSSFNEKDITLLISILVSPGIASFKRAIPSPAKAYKRCKKE